MPSVRKDDPHVIEICAAGIWLLDTLSAADVGAGALAKANFDFGQSCTPQGDPWRVAERVIEATDSPER